MNWKFAMVSLLLVSFAQSSFGYCSWDDNSCNEREAESRRQDQAYQSALDQQAREYRYELDQREHDLYIDRQARERESLEMYAPQKSGARDIICAYGDNDC